MKVCVVTFDWRENDAVEKVKHYRRHGRIVWAVVELTNSCNLNCAWCYAASGNLKHGKHMSTEKLEKLIRILKDNGVKQITYSGGEPTVYPHIREAVRLAKENGFIVHMNTNGYILNRNFARQLADCGLTQVQINIDSLNPRTHDRIRGREGSFKRAIQALKNAKKFGITTVSQTVITKETEGEIFKIFSFAKRMGIERSRVWDITPSGNAVNNMHLIPTDYIETLKKLSAFAYENGARRIESGDPLFPNGFETKLEVSGGFCTAVRGAFMTISCTGDVFPCVTQRIPLYNIFDVGNQDLFEFHISKITEFAESISIPDMCKSCDSFQHCSGGCMTRRKFWGGRDYNCSALNREFNQ